ncbi:hypothetical protein CLOM_g17776 [Closterium sp. NIES-68]|nr:hypothetical protein CLOM_g17776 [Closterium sp. NIES-68]GJP61544.1 hypothetical protein CLOP_g18690 [Closterium sp. NIES-67]
MMEVVVRARGRFSLAASSSHGTAIAALPSRCLTAEFGTLALRRKSPIGGAGGLVKLAARVHEAQVRASCGTAMAATQPAQGEGNDARAVRSHIFRSPT